MNTNKRAGARGTLRALCVAALAATWLTGACNKNDGEAQEPSHPGGAPDAWFQLIPADSPLVMANLRSVPDPFIDWLAQGLAPLGEMLETKIQEELAKTQDKQERAVLTELQGKLSRDGLRSIGVSLQPRYAIYAIGPSLAMRFGLEDGARFAEFVDRLEAASGESLSKQTFEDITYRVHSDDEVTGVFAIHGNEVIVGIMHTNAREHVLPVLFGKKAPEAALAGTRALEDLVEKYELMGVSPGYLDIAAAVRMLTGRGSALSSTILAASGVELPPLSATCHQELDQMAAVAPRIVFGYRSMSSTGMHSMAVWEMRNDLAQELAALRSPLPGASALGSEKPLFAMGLGLDLSKTLAWVKAKAKVLQATPFQCELLGELNQAVNEAARDFEAELPPYVTGFRGVLLAVSSFSMQNFSPSGTGYALLGMENPMALVEMAQAQIPQLAEVEIQANGKPTTIPLGIPGIEALHVAVQGSWIGAAVGEAELARVTALIQEQPAATSPLAVLAYNYKKLMDMMRQTGGMTGNQDELRVIEAIGNMFGFTTLNLMVDERGLVMHQSMEPF